MAFLRGIQSLSAMANRVAHGGGCPWSYQEIAAHPGHYLHVDGALGRPLAQPDIKSNWSRSYSKDLQFPWSTPRRSDNAMVCLRHPGYRHRVRCAGTRGYIVTIGAPGSHRTR